MRRRKRLKIRGKRRDVRRRVARGTLSLGVLFVALALSILLNNPRRAVAQSLHSVPLTIPRDVVLETDMPDRAPVDPNPDPYDDGSIRRHCAARKEGKEGKNGGEGAAGCRWTDGLFSSVSRATPDIFVPAPGTSTGLLGAGFALMGLSLYLRKRHTPENFGEST